MSSRHRDRSRSRDRERHKERDKTRDRDRDRERDRDRDKDRERDRDRNRDRDRDRDRERHRSKRDKERERSRSRERHKEKRRSRSRSRSRSRGRKSKDRDGTIALLDQMVGTTTKATSRQVTTNGSINPATQAAILAAAAVAQTFVAQRRMAAPVQPAAAAAAALSAASAIPPPTSVQQKLEQLQARSESRDSRYRSEKRDDYHPDDDKDDGQGPPGETAAERRARRRRTRWMGSEHDKTFIPGLPTVLPSTLTREQEEQYLLQLQIEEVSRKLRSGDLGIPANVEERSPSPEPIYSTDGKRLNTREYRTRRKLEEERHRLVQRMHQINPEFKPPPDYKPPIIRVHDKVMIPQEEHPDINFVGLLIGPRGNTLKAMEKETGAKIIIRGKGSVKEGKVGRKDGQPLPGEDEPLHAYITATNADCVKKAVEKIKEVIRQGVEVPEGQNDLRRMQLRELAQLNGTLRENDGPRCANCTATDHKTWMCPDKPNVTNSIVCSSCGGAGHIARDCRAKRPGQGQLLHHANKAKIDEEYMSLMAELGEAPPGAGGGALGGGLGGPRRAGLGLFQNSQAPRAIMPANLPASLPPPPGAFPPPPPPHVQAGQPAPWLAGVANNQPPPPGSAPLPAFPPPPPPSPRHPHPLHQGDNQMGGPNMPGGPHMPPPPGMMGMAWRGPFGPPWAPPPPAFLAPPPPPPPASSC
ncbi:PREDICTED: splicing factor 1 isoform X2 [Papilio polytes]|uniref:splicing factor 1 isoform X2 n=1 Tax=Papilio polytes TaxID=76194 RepID=UPI0006767F0B|nr:PREDICTED: splicing factor 1 isoform X2 [Papilio polytes]